MDPVGSTATSPSWAKDLNFDNPKLTGSEKAFKKAAKSLEQAQADYLDAISGGKGPLSEGEIAKWEGKLQSAVRVYEAAQRISQMIHELIMSAIRSIRV